MRAVGVNHYGGPEALEVVDLPEPHAGPGQLRIRVHAAAVNPTDTYVRNGDRAKQQQKDPPPYVPGMDAAGFLDEIGDGVETDLRVGDAVMAIVLPDGSHGAYSEHLALPVGSVARAPKGASHAEACTLPMNGLTARLSLDELALSPGDTILVTGAAGAYGGYVVQLAKADGLRVIADASPADEALVAALGADVVLARGDDLAERVRELEPGGVDGAADGAVMNQLLVPAVRDGGGFASVRGWKGEAQRDITFYATMVRRYLEEQARLDRLREQAERGAVTLRVARTFPAEQAGEAHRQLEGGGVRGRLVIEL
jgi:NADPH:quinone reductase-like Zn-dependent oxidoreductase